MVTARHVPFYMCSFIPYVRSQRQSRTELRKDGGRKRNTSGPRPLSALSDAPDPFDLLGIEKSQDGQVNLCTTFNCFVF